MKRRGRATRARLAASKAQSARTAANALDSSIEADSSQKSDSITRYADGTGEDKNLELNNNPDAMSEDSDANERSDIDAESSVLDDQEELDDVREEEDQIDEGIGEASDDEIPRKRPKKTRESHVRQPNRANSRSSEQDIINGRALYQSVYERKADMQSIAASWLDQYNKDHSKALTIFINFILLSSGCSINLQPHDIENPDNAIETLSQIEEAHLPQSSKEYPLIASKLSEFKNFKANLVSFVEQFVEQGAARGMIYEGDLFDSAYVWVAALSSSGLRPFRHTATVIALSTITCLCNVHNSISNQISTNEKQCTSQQKKSRPPKSLIKQLEDEKEALQNHLKGTSQFIGDLFDGMFVHRYRDIDSRIRAESAREMGKWILALPSTFLDPIYLRYLGWLLSDSNASVRLEVMKTLEKLYSKSDFVGGLRHFTDRFRNRIIQIVREDIDNNVRTTTLRIVSNMRECGFLSNEIVNQINNLILDPESTVQKAAFEFFKKSVNDIVHDQLEDIGSESKIDIALGSLSTSDPNYMEKIWIWHQTAFTLIAEMEKDTSITTTPFYYRIRTLAERIIANTPEFQDWKSLLLYIKSPLRREGPQKKVTNSVLKSLQNLIGNSEQDDALCLAIFGGAVKGILSSRESRGKKSMNFDQVSKSELENTFASSLMDFLYLFGSSAQSVTQILAMSQNVKLSALEKENSGLDKAQFLGEITKQFRNHDTEDVLHEVALTFLHFSEDPLGASLVMNEIESLQSFLFETYTSFFDKYPSESAWEASKCRLSISVVQRTENLLLLNNVLAQNTQTENEILKFLLECMQKNADSFENVEKLVCSAMNSFRLFFCWIIKEGETSDYPRNEIDLLVKSTLKASVFSLSRPWSSSARSKLCRYLLDLLIVCQRTVPQQVPRNVQFKIVKILDGTLCALAKKLGKDFVSILDYDENDEDDQVKPDEDYETASALELEDRACKLAAKIVLVILSDIFTRDFNAGLKSVKGVYSRTIDAVLSHLQDKSGLEQSEELPNSEAVHV